MAARRGSKFQNINITDLICEGPIYGFPTGLSDIYLDDVPIEEGSLSQFIPVTTGTSGRAVITNEDITESLSASFATLDEDFPAIYTNYSENPRSIVLTNFKEASSLTTAFIENTSSTSRFMITSSQSAFDASWQTSGSNKRKGYLAAIGSRVPGEIIYDGAKSVIFVTEREQSVNTDCSWTLTQQRAIGIKEVYYEGNAKKMRLWQQSVSAGTYNYYITRQPNFSYGDSSVMPIENWQVVGKVENLNAQFRRGSGNQTPFNEVGGVGGAIAEQGNLNSIQNPELKILKPSKASELGLLYLTLRACRT